MIHPAGEIGTIIRALYPKSRTFWLAPRIYHFVKIKSEDCAIEYLAVSLFLIILITHRNKIFTSPMFSEHCCLFDPFSTKYIIAFIFV